MFDKYFKISSIKNYNFLLLACCIILNIMGVLFVASASSLTSKVALRQIGGSFISAAICIFISFIRFDQIMNMAIIAYGMVVTALVWVLSFGTSFGKNATRWIEIPFVGQIQPAEFAKIALIITLASFLKDKDINKPKNLLIFFAMYAFMAILVIVQPNLSAVILITVIMACIFFVSKIKTRTICILSSIIILIFAMLFGLFRTGILAKLPFIRPYQIERIETFFNPEDNSEGNWQQENSLKAIGSGRIVGKGYNNDSNLSVKNGGWLAEEANDFIFAVIGEEIGFRGCMFIIILYIIIIIQCFSLAASAINDAVKYVCTGVGSWIAFQTFVNIGVSIRILPNTGVPLPFFSQGVSSLLSIYLGVALVLNVSKEKKYFK